MSENGAQEEMVGARRRGRPRSEQARLAILDASAELLSEHGMAEVSMDAVAERAGVSKATIYRWWPTKEMLALDAVYRSWAEVEPQPPDTGSLSDDLLALLLPWVRYLRSQPYGRLVAAFIAQSHSDPIFAEHFQARCVSPRLKLGTAVFSRGVARGEIPSDTDVQTALDLVYGPIIYRLLYRHASLNDDFVMDLVDDVLAALRRDRERDPAD